MVASHNQTQFLKARRRLAHSSRAANSPRWRLSALRGLWWFCRDGCRAGDDEDLDLLPPPADGAPEPVRLRLSGLFDQDLQAVFGGGRACKGPCGQQGPELVLDQPRPIVGFGSPMFFLMEPNYTTLPDSRINDLSARLLPVREPQKTASVQTKEPSTIKVSEGLLHWVRQGPEMLLVPAEDRQFFWHDNVSIALGTDSLSRSL